MARPTKCRRICHYPNQMAFSPIESDANKEIITLTIDEYETLRLIDFEGFSQEQCAKSLQIARTTVQKIYDTARTKLAKMLVEGCSLKIVGGDYKFCDGNNNACYKEGCNKQQILGKYYSLKGDDIMRIAVTYCDGQIFGHFGHTEQFKIYDVKDGKVVNSQVVDTNGSGHGALAGLLGALSVDVLICGGIGGGAQMALKEAGIKLFGGVLGSADDAVKAYLENTLDYNPNVKCSHHDHEHGEGHHTCGSHGCGSGHCGNH